MSVRRAVGEPVALAAGVPEGLVALRLDEVVVDDEGASRIRTDRRGRTRIDRVVLRAKAPTGLLPHDQPHGPVRRALATTTRKRTGPSGRAPDALAAALARAGLVDLHAAVVLGPDGLHAGRWNRWERTAAGAAWAETYADVPAGDSARFAAATADQLTGGTAHDWRQRFTATAADVDRMLRAAVALVADGTSDGWALSRFANRVCGHTHALDSASPLAPLVLRHLADRMGLDVDPSTAEGRAEVFDAAELGVDQLASWVACTRVPPGDGPAADLLRVGVKHDMPVLVPRVALHIGRPVAPPPAGSSGWIFAVENEASLTEAHRLQTSAPVVWYGSTAALRLLRAAAAAGWRVAVSADFEPGGLRRAAWVLDRLGAAAVPWRLAVSDHQRTLEAGVGVDDLPARFSLPGRFADLLEPMQSSRVRVTEEDRLQRLLDDIAGGEPTSVGCVSADL